MTHRGWALLEALLASDGPLDVAERLELVQSMHPVFLGKTIGRPIRCSQILRIRSSATPMHSVPPKALTRDVHLVCRKSSS
jgi:hypothetical protein